MKTIKGKKYFISLGYVDKYPVDIKCLKTFFKKSGCDEVYVDDSDKDNIIVIPLLSINEIQKKNGIFKFNIMITPRNIHFDDDNIVNTINTIGLFEVDNNEDKQIIKIVSFFKCNLSISRNDKIIPLSVEVNERVILGEK